MARNVYCVFEGGGAKGVAHVGALRAIHNKNEFSVGGYAGASAGAIVASLAAAGWQADELLKIGGKGEVSSKAFSCIGDESARSLADLFGSEWETILSFRMLLESGLIGGGKFSRLSFRFALQFLFLLFWPLIYLHGNSMFAPSIFSDLSLPLTYFFKAVTGGALAVGWAGYLYVVYLMISSTYKLLNIFKGLASMREVVGGVDKLLLEKIPVENGARVTFDDIYRTRSVDLKIVAANVRTGQMALFDRISSPHVPVADAVAASAAIPFIFEPVRIDGEEYCDGGLVSNLPAWSFDPEVLLDPDCLVITCELPETEIESDKKQLAGIQLFQRIARTAVFGAEQLNTRGLSNHLSLSLSPDLGLLEFDNTGRHIEAVVDAEDVSSLRIEFYLLEQESVREIHTEVLKYVSKVTGSADGTRTAVVRKVQVLGDRLVAYRLWYQQGFEDSVDGDILLPPEGSLVGDCVSKGSWAFAEKANTAEWSEFLAIPHAKRLVPQDREWVVAIPLRTNIVYNGEQTKQISVALTIDSPQIFKDGVEKHAEKLRDIVDKHGCFTPY